MSSFEFPKAKALTGKLSFAFFHPLGSFIKRVSKYKGFFHPAPDPVSWHEASEDRTGSQAGGAGLLPGQTGPFLLPPLPVGFPSSHLTSLFCLSWSQAMDNNGVYPITLLWGIRRLTWKKCLGWGLVCLRHLRGNYSAQLALNLCNSKPLSDAGYRAHGAQRHWA